MREGTFKIDRAIRAVEAMQDTWPMHSVEWETYEQVLDKLREIRETDAGQKP